MRIRRVKLTRRGTRCDVALDRERSVSSQAHPVPGENMIMTRTLRGSLLIASMLVVTWATSSEACCHRRRASARHLLLRGLYLEHGLLRRGRLGMGGGGYYNGGYAAAAGYTATVRPARLRLRPARLRLRPARLQPGRPRRASVRAGGAARPGRRRLRPGALTVHRSSDRPAGRAGLNLGFTRGGVGGGQSMGAAAGYRSAGGREGSWHANCCGRASLR